MIKKKLLSSTLKSIKWSGKDHDIKKDVMKHILNGWIFPEILPLSCTNIGISKHQKTKWADIYFLKYDHWDITCIWMKKRIDHHLKFSFSVRLYYLKFSF